MAPRGNVSQVEKPPGYVGHVVALGDPVDVDPVARGEELEHSPEPSAGREELVVAGSSALGQTPQLVARLNRLPRLLVTKIGAELETAPVVLVGRARQPG